MTMCAFLLFAASLWLGGVLAGFQSKFCGKIHKNAEFLGEISSENSQNAKFNDKIQGENLKNAEFQSKFSGENSRNVEFGDKFQGKFSPNLKLKYALTLIFTALFLAPFYEGFCVADFLFAFFDAPSPLCLLLLAFFVLKNLLKDFAPKNSHKAQIFATSIKPAALVLLCLYGLLLYLGNLDLIPLDIYNQSPIFQAFYAFALLLALYFTDKFCAILALIALLPFVFGLSQNPLTMLICPYLWLFSLIKTLEFTLKWSFARLLKPQKIAKNSQNLKAQK